MTIANVQQISEILMLPMKSLPTWLDWIMLKQSLEYLLLLTLHLSIWWFWMEPIWVTCIGPKVISWFVLHIFDNFSSYIFQIWFFLLDSAIAMTQTIAKVMHEELLNHLRNSPQNFGCIIDGMSDNSNNHYVGKLIGLFDYWLKKIIYEFSFQ